MAIYKIDVGADRETSVKQLKIDLTEILSEVNREPHKVKVAIDRDALNKELEWARTQIRATLDQLGDAGIKILSTGGDPELNNMVDRLETVKKLMKDVDDEHKKIQRAYSKTTGVLNNLKETPENKKDLDELNAKYDTYINKLTVLRKNKSVATAEDIQGMHKIQAEMDEIIARIQTRLGIEKEGDKANAQIAREEIAKINRLKRIDTLQQQVQSGLRNWTKAQGGKSSTSYEDLGKINTELDELAIKLRTGAISTEEFDKAYADLSRRVGLSRKNIRGANEDTQKFTDRFKNLASKFGAWLSASKVIMYVYHSLRKMFSAAVEINSAMAQLQIVTGASDSELKKFSQTAVSLAKDIGKSVVEITKSIETFSRLGYSLSDASQLAKYASIMSNVAGVGSEEATTGLTSIIKGFNLDVDQAEHVADVLVNVGQRYAVSAGEMMEAYEKSGAALSATNTSLEKSAGLIAAANASVQDASVIGTALKTVSARIRGSKTDLEELGENTEDLADGFSKYAKEIKALTGFDIMIDESHFKDLYDIMDGISKVWKNLSDTQRARVSEILGGTRQLQVISSIIGNWSDAVGAYDTAMDSAGASARANAIYMDTMNAHMDQLKATFEELSEEVMESGVIKFIVDRGKDILWVLKQITSLTGSLGTILLGGKIYKGYKKISSVIGEEGFSKLSGMEKWKEISDKIIPNLKNGFVDLGKALKSLVTHSGSFKDNLKAAGVNFKTFWAQNKISLIITAILAVISIIKSVAGSVEEAARQAEEAADKAREKAESTKKESAELDDLISKYKDLAKAGKISASNREEAASIQKQISDLLGSEAGSLDLINGKYKEQLELLQGISAKKQEESVKNSEEALRLANANIDSPSSGTEGIAYGGVPLFSNIASIVEYWNRQATKDSRRYFTFDAENDGSDVLNKVLKDIRALNIPGVDVTFDETNGLLYSFKIGFDADIDYSSYEDAWEKIIDAADQAGAKKLYTDLINIRDKIFGKDGSVTKARTAAEEFIKEGASYSANTALFDNRVKSYEDYLKLRKEIIDVILENEQIRSDIDSHVFETTDVESWVDGVLGTLDGFSDYYAEWFDKTESDTAQNLEKIKQLYQTNTPTNTSSITGFAQTMPGYTGQWQSAREYEERYQSEVEEINAWIDSLAGKERDLISEIYEKSDPNDLVTWDLDRWREALRKAKKEYEETAPSKLPDIFKEEDKSGKSFNDRIKEYRDNIESLSDALEKFRSGDMDAGAFADLVEKFPQLAGRANDLDVAIVELMDDMDSDIKDDFDKQWGNLDTQADRDALKAFEEQLLSLRDSSIKFHSSLDNVVSAFSTVKSVMKDYNTNGFLTLENLNSIIALDDKYIAALTNEKGALDLSADGYKRLVQAEITELKAQTLQDSLDTVSKMTSRAEALEYLSSNQTDAASASLSLADAQWQEAYSMAAIKDIQEGTGDLYRRTVEQAREAYDVRIALIDNYAETAFTVGELSTTTDEYTESLNNEKDALEESKKALEQQKTALEDTKKGYEDALGAVKDLVEWVQNYIKQIKEDEIDALEKKKESIDDLIEKQKELLAAEKDEYEWNKKISEKQNTVAKDALAASIASLDDSAAGRKAQKQADDKLIESRSDLYDTLYDHEIELRKESLDKLKEEQDKYYDDQINEIRDYLSDEVRLYKDACAMIDNDSGDLYGKLLEYCRNYTTTSEAEFNYMWNSAQSAMREYNTANLSTFELLNNLQGRIYDVDRAIDTVASSISSYESAIEGVQTKLENLSNQAKRTISDIRAATDAQNRQNSLKGNWYYMWQGHPYYSNKKNRDDAIVDILHHISAEYGGVYPASAATIYGEIKHFARGTSSAPGGLAEVNERGHEIRILNKGDGILTAKITKNLSALGANPAQFLADASQRLISNLLGSNGRFVLDGIGASNTSVNPEINIVIQGDATQSTVNALKAQSRQIINTAKKELMSETLARRASSRA